MQEEIGKPVASQRKSESTLSDASGADGDAQQASQLVAALDDLLLERAVREHREALARLNKLKLALNRDET